MRVTLNVEKRHIYTLSVCIGILIGVIIVNAYGTSTPSVFGHTWSEIDNFPPACPSGQVAKGLGPSLTCILDTDTRCDSPGIDCNLDAKDLSTGSVGTSEIADSAIKTADIGNNQITSTKVDTSICKASGADCKAYTLQIKKISGAINACDREISDIKTRNGPCSGDCINNGFGQCLFAQQPDCSMIDCSTTSIQHTCTCQKIV